MKRDDVVTVGYANEAADTDVSENDTKPSAGEETEVGSDEQDTSAEIADDEQDTDEATSSEESETEDEQAPVKKSKADVRIEKLLKRETEAKREAEELRQRLAALEAKVAPVEQPAEAVVEVQLPQEPQPEDYNTNAEYVKAILKHEREVERIQTEAANHYETQKALVEKVSKAIGEAAQRGKAKYDDFEQVASSVKVAPTAEMYEYLAESDVPEDVIYYLSKNQDEYDVIRKLGPKETFRAMSRLEVKLAKSATIKASEPIKPVKTKSAPDTSLRHTDDTDAWLAKRRKEKFGR